MCIIKIMEPGGTNIWFNFAYGRRVNTPKGCLLNAEGSRLIFFERCKKSPINNIKIFTHMFYTNHLGEPAGFKSTSKIRIEDAWEKWNTLQEQGWTEVYHNFG